MQTTIHLQLDDNKFWQYDEASSSQAEADINAIQALAGPFKWSMAVKGKGQRKYHSRSVMTISLWAMLDMVKQELRDDCTASVRVLTPDVELQIRC